MNVMIKALLLLIVGYCLLVITVYAIQDHLLYMPVRQISSTPADIGLSFEDITMITKDGQTIHGWWVPAQEEKGTLLFCHGNAGNVSHRLDSIKIFHSLGLNVLIFDYRGYGKSSGRATEEGMYLDAEAAWDHIVREKRKHPDNIVVFGRSLGGAVAAETALRRDAGCLIVESAFTSVPDMATRIYPWLPVRLISKYGYATVEKVSQVRYPKLVVFSAEDEVVPPNHGERIYKNALPPKDVLVLRGDHNSAFLVSGRQYTDGLRGFLEKYCLGNQGR